MLRAYSGGFRTPTRRAPAVASELWTAPAAVSWPGLACSREVAAVRYEVGPEGLRERSERVARASAAAAALQLGEDVARLQRAMPGARSAEASAQLAREWDDMLC